MSTPEPTAEHIAEASAWLSRDRDGTHYGDVQDLAHALAAAEARGFERGIKEATAIVETLARTEPTYAQMITAEDYKTKEPR